MSSAAFPCEPVLIVDDDEDMQRSYGYVLRGSGIDNMAHCSDSREVEDMLAAKSFGMVLLDLNMPYISGRELLPIITNRYPDTPVIVVTGVDHVETAVTCMKNGAFDYLVKPVNEDDLLAAIRRAVTISETRRENQLLKERLLSTELTNPEAFEAIITCNKAMHAIFQYMEAVAGSQQPILITGETGVGKELIANAVHKLSGRTGQFVAVNIAGLDDNIFSDTLFGHLRGAFTGATETRQGLIETAADGTLFLDEIGELALTSQVKLLRLLQEREYLPLGADTPYYTTARVVVATNRTLTNLRDSADFRDDLYYRLRPHHVEVPPLRERLDDLPVLVDNFLQRAASELGKKKPTPPPELMTLLGTYAFPGNIRELEGMVFNAVSTHKGGVLSMDTFKQVITSRPSAAVPLPEAAQAQGALFGLSTGTPLPTLREAEDILATEAMRQTNGNQTMAAALLGITRQTLRRYLKRAKA